MIRPTFYGLEIAKTGLYMSQLGLDVTAHNIANVDTEGYTRQRLVTQAIDPFNADFRLKPLNTYKVGGGVELKILDQIRDEFLDSQFRNEQSNYSYWQTRAQGLGYIEPLYDTLGSGGLLVDSISELFDAFAELSRNSSDLEPREVAKQAALTMIDAFQQTYNSLVEQRSVQNDAVKGTADAINDIIEQISMLNQTIHRYEYNNGMQQANDLRDQRNLLLDQLSALIDIDYTESNGYLNISFGGESLVNGTTVNKIQYQLVDDSLTGEANSYYELYLGEEEVEIDNGDGTTSTVTVPKTLDMNNVTGGELGGHLSLRDNSSETNPGIPYFIGQINRLAAAIVKEINAIHAEGYTFPADENGNVCSNGINFFADFINISEMSLSDEVLESAWNIACSSEPIDLSDPENAKGGNNLNALRLAALIESTTLGDISSIEGFITTMVAEVASAVKHSKDVAKALGSNVLNIDNNRTSICGVSLDEEMTNMIKYQYSYDANARMITTMDEMLNTLINGMGIVGRS